jgi:hypothetical protein
MSLWRPILTDGNGETVYAQGESSEVSETLRVEVDIDIHPVTERIEHRVETTFVVIDRREREASPWKAILASVGALAGILILALASIWAVLLLVDNFDKKSDGPEVTSLIAENAALKQKFDDYVGHCEDSSAPGGIDRLRVINDHNPGATADQGLVYAACVTSENILGGRITSP